MCSQNQTSSGLHIAPMTAGLVGTSQGGIPRASQAGVDEPAKL